MLDFFGVPVKANDLLTRVQELQLLAKRISRYDDPIAQFRVLMYLKPSTWSKGCGWNQSTCYSHCYFNLFYISFCHMKNIIVFPDFSCFSL